jgi:hypothetical protein
MSADPCPSWIGLVDHGPTMAWLNPSAEDTERSGTHGRADSPDAWSFSKDNLQTLAPSSFIVTVEVQALDYLH